MPGRLDGKVCVITGAASGIGAESARVFSRRRARVSQQSTSRTATAEVSIVADVTDEDQVSALAAGSRRARPGRRPVQQRRHQPE